MFFVVVLHSRIYMMTSQTSYRANFDRARFPFHVDGYGFTTASCLKAYPELSCFEDLKSHIHGGFVTSKLETSIPCEKIPASNFNPWSNETTFYKETLYHLR